MPDNSHRIYAVLLSAFLVSAPTKLLAYTTSNESDICNVQDYMAMNMQDAGAAGRACIASGTKNILFPPGDYTVKSLVQTTGTHDFPLEAFWFNGAQNVKVTAYGARFYLADSAQGTIGSSYVGVTGNSKNIEWRGGEFFGNRIGLAAGQVNNGMCFENVSRLTIADVTFRGDYSNGSALCGVYGFGIRLWNVHAYSVAIGLDFAYNQDVDVQKSIFTGGTSLASVGISNIADVPTYQVGIVTDDEGNPMNLRNGQANGLVFRDNTITGFHSCVALDDVNGAQILRNDLSGCVFSTGYNAGILLQTSAETQAQGFITRNILIQKNIITDNGNPNTSSVNGGILLATNNIGLDDIWIIGNAIYDNCGNGIGPATLAGIGYVYVEYNNFTSHEGPCTQAASVDPATVAYMGSLLVLKGNIPPP